MSGSVGVGSCTPLSFDSKSLTSILTGSLTSSPHGSVTPSRNDDSVKSQLIAGVAARVRSFKEESSRLKLRAAMRPFLIRPASRERATGIFLICFETRGATASVSPKRAGPMTSLTASEIWNAMIDWAPEGSMCSFMLSGSSSMTLLISTPEVNAVTPAAMHAAQTLKCTVTAARPYCRIVDINPSLDSAPSPDDPPNARAARIPPLAPWRGAAVTRPLAGACVEAPPRILQVFRSAVARR
mmetsp:Transcript_8763/g.21699  ORF Transcript_8763/g.21699 Transcript_8763/m.21699 type:complete len:241 (+) Transcript_8763:214-936(+)